MSKLSEILSSGRAPGFNTKAKAPDSADVAIPRALRQMEEKHGAKKIARDAGYSVNQLKQTWSM